MSVATVGLNKLGRRKPVTRPRLQLADFHVEGANGTFEPPPAEHRTDWPLIVNMYANGPDPTVTLSEIVKRFGVGCCVQAARFNAIRHMRYGSGLPLPPFTGDEALRCYARDTGYDWTQTQPDGSNPTDRGTDPNASFTNWLHEGIPLPAGLGVDRIGGFVGVNPKDPREWQTAIAELDVLLTGYDLPLTIRQQPAEWTVVDASLQGESAPGSLGGHEVLTVSYDEERDRVEEWAERKLIAREFKAVYCDQATAICSPDQLNKTGVSETGLDRGKLAEALHELAA